ncbi:hypothetical protein SELMODRAFT_431948 [Selaginella moellendorffii]|uniref:Uncharacterized protein n=1 Tax=Selaginella moellendorffii TaxID=88036 RepID=D8TEG9_SELML|nr:hypothetical protein SELMODRAFT_431948 [Selaginella moellendorffii]
MDASIGYQDWSYRHGQTRLQVRGDDSRFWVHILHTNVGEHGHHHLHTFDSSTNAWELTSRAYDWSSGEWSGVGISEQGKQGLLVFPKPEELAGYTYCRAFPFRSGPRIMVAALCCIDNTAALGSRMDDGGLALLEVDHESGLLKAISGVVVKQLHDYRGDNVPEYHLQWFTAGVNLLVSLDDFYFLWPVAFDMRRHEFPRSCGHVRPCCIYTPLAPQ